jgi:hypothetical protein
MVRSLASRAGGHHRMGRAHAAAKATEAAASEATEAATAAPRRITGTPTYGYEPTHEAAMATFAKSWRRDRTSTPKPRMPYSCRM